MSFPSKQGSEKAMFLLFIEISWNHWKKMIWTTLLGKCRIYYYLLNRTRLGLALNKTFWIQKIPKLYFKQHQHVLFHTPNTVGPREIELAKFDCINNCSIDNSSKYSYFCNSIPAWLY